MSGAQWHCVVVIAGDCAAGAVCQAVVWNNEPSCQSRSGKDISSVCGCTRLPQQMPATAGTSCCMFQTSNVTLLLMHVNVLMCHRWSITVALLFYFLPCSRRTAEATQHWSPVHNPNMTKGQENLLVALANQRRVVGLTLPNSSGSFVCVLIMEYLATI